jgi:dTDP-D-glucose 4,6-dehydratase
VRLLVTGGAGFIGSNYVRRLFDNTLQGVTSVVVLDKLTYAGVKENLAPVFNNTNFTFVEGDICDPVIVSQLVESVDAVVNFAAESHVDRSISSAADFIKTNVAGVQVLLDAIKASGKKFDSYKYQLMRFMVQSRLVRGMKIFHFSLIPLIPLQKLAESCWLVRITGLIN